MDAHWKKRTDFAEYAEPLAIDTDHVLGAVVASSTVTVLFSRDVDSLDAAVYLAALRRDASGVLRVIRPPVDTGYTVGDYLPPLP